MELKDITARLKRLIITAILVAAMATTILVGLELILLSVLAGSILPIVSLTLPLLFSAGPSLE